MKRIFLLIGWLLAFGSAMAGGFQVNLQGVRQAGMAHTGAGLAFDASSVFFNPGGLANSNGGVVVGFMPIFGRIAYREPAPGVYTASNEPGMSTPFSAFAAYRLPPFEGGHKLAFGGGVYTPFGSRVVYADDWKGQFALREISLQAIYMQVNAAYAYKGIFGIGGSLVYGTGNVTLRKAIPAQFANGEYGEATLSGAANGWGFTAGIYAHPIPQLSIGLNHRSKISFAAEGDAEFTVPDDLAQYFPNTTFTSELPLPATTTLGLAYFYRSDAHVLNLRDVVCVDVNYVSWSAYQSLAFDFAQNTDKLEDTDSPRNYRNAFIFRAGWQGGVHENILVRAGAYLDLTPVPDGYTTPETPDAHKIGLSAGASYVNNRFRVNAAFLWIEGMARTDINQELNFGGTYKSRALIPSVGLAYHFQ